MKYLLPPALSGILLLLVSFIKGKESTSLPMPVSPLASYSTVWNEAKYLSCNTAINAGYINAGEKEVIYILNMIRMNPVLFANTVVKQYPDKNNQGYLHNSTYYKSLLTALIKLKPQRLLYPDSLCYESAYCHAFITGKNGIVGHDRTVECRSKQNFNGECCDYGYDKPLDILLSLLIDDGVPSLGHREICLYSYKKLGVSIQPHLSYRYTAVLDFIF